MLSGFWSLRGWGSLIDSVKKEKSVTNPFFQIMLNEVPKMISGDVKTNVKQQEIKDLVVVS